MVNWLRVGWVRSLGDFHRPSLDSGGRAGVRGVGEGWRGEQMSKGKGELYGNRRYPSTTSRRILILVLKMITQGQACLIVLSEF